MRRDLVVVRRIVLLSTPLALVGIPASSMVIPTIMLGDLLSHNMIRIALVSSCIPLSVILLILFWYTLELCGTINIFQYGLQRAL